jgi:hypothetical protein
MDKKWIVLVCLCIIFVGIAGCASISGNKFRVNITDKYVSDGKMYVVVENQIFTTGTACTDTNNRLGNTLDFWDRSACYNELTVGKQYDVKLGNEGLASSNIIIEHIIREVASN